MAPNEQRLERAERDIEKLQGMWKVLSRIEKQNATILSKLEYGHPCRKEKEVQQLLDFKETAEDIIKNSISRNQAIILVVLSFALGYFVKIF